MDLQNLNGKEILVVPDIHCRKFWRDILQYPGEIVFLGDYMDPYPYEFYVTDRDQIDQIVKEGLDNFREIIEFAKANKDRVHLLLGNHDQLYISLSETTCRTSIKYEKDIYNLLNDNKELFNIAYRWNNVLFTHAGVCQEWLKQNELECLDADSIEDYLNNLLHSRDWEMADIHWTNAVTNYIETSLGDVGYSRGGYQRCGSPTWADVSDMLNSSAFENELIQIVGHTQLKDTGTFIHKKNFFACDSRSCFIWDGNTLKPYKNEN